VVTIPTDTSATIQSLPSRSILCPSPCPLQKEHTNLIAKALLSKLPTHSPIALYNPDPECPEEGRRAKVSGTVLSSLTVGTDGLAYDVTVTKPQWHGFDEQPVRSVQEWRFEPADGKPVPARITVEVSFSIYK
jgi:TonB family protein